MTSAKKIIKNIAETGFEVVKDTAKQISETVGPEALLSAALNKPKGESELTKYLQDLADPNLATKEALDKRAKEQLEKDEAERKKILGALILPEHMKPIKKPEGMRPYEKTIEEEKRKAAMVEAQKKQQASSQPLKVPKGRRKGRLGMPQHQKAATGLETKQNVKMG